MAAIQDLPVELLLLIFEYAYLSFEKHATDAISLPYPAHALSACRLWRTILRLNFIHLYIDEYSSTYVDQISRQIQESNPGLPLDIFVINRSVSAVYNDAEKQREHQIIHHLMNIISPIVKRCRTLVFNLKYSSSLPLLSQDFSGPAPDLLVLKTPITQLKEPTITDPFIVPKLSVLALDGLTFPDAFLLPTWASQMKGINLDTLSISHLGPIGHFNTKRLLEYCALPSRIRHLILDDLHLEPGHLSSSSQEDLNSSRLDLTKLSILNPRKLSLANMFSSPPLRAFKSRSVLPYLCLAGRNLGINHHVVPMTHHLRLEGIPVAAGMAWQGFMCAMNRYFGEKLELVQCAGLSDMHLEQVGRACERADNLEVVVEEGNTKSLVSVEGLKKMVRVREEEVRRRSRAGVVDALDECEVIRLAYKNYFSPDLEKRWRPRPVPFRRLRVVGLRGVLSEEDRTWFVEKVGDFSWA
ncbi:hypothetical protein CPC08DRAFT_714379 [Agrocybe pediades]|nr:hypothetical protein CPC08DRAFT_714379 [Agrocybe pediades]